MIQLVWVKLVFKCPLRLHYHTSCSYGLHNCCFYRVFSFQEFKKNDSRTSCSSSNYSTNFREKQVKEKDKKKEVCVKPWLKKEKNLEFDETLLAQLRLKDKYNYNHILRMTSENVEGIFQLIKEDIAREH